MLSRDTTSGTDRHNAGYAKLLKGMRWDVVVLRTFNGWHCVSRALSCSRMAKKPQGVMLEQETELLKFLKRTARE